MLTRKPCISFSEDKYAKMLFPEKSDDSKHEARSSFQQWDRHLSNMGLNTLNPQKTQLPSVSENSSRPQSQSSSSVYSGSSNKPKKNKTRRKMGKEQFVDNQQSIKSETSGREKLTPINTSSEERYDPSTEISKAHFSDSSHQGFIESKINFENVLNRSRVLQTPHSILQSAYISDYVDSIANLSNHHAVPDETLNSNTVQLLSKNYQNNAMKAMIQYRNYQDLQHSQTFLTQNRSVRKKAHLGKFKRSPSNLDGSLQSFTIKSTENPFERSIIKTRVSMNDLRYKDMYSQLDPSVKASNLKDIDERISDTDVLSSIFNVPAVTPPAFTLKRSVSRKRKPRRKIERKSPKEPPQSKENTSQAEPRASKVKLVRTKKSTNPAPQTRTLTPNHRKQFEHLNKKFNQLVSSQVNVSRRKANERSIQDKDPPKVDNTEEKGAKQKGDSVEKDSKQTNAVRKSQSTSSRESPIKGTSSSVDPEIKNEHTENNSQERWSVNTDLIKDIEAVKIETIKQKIVPVRKKIIIVRGPPRVANTAGLAKGCKPVQKTPKRDVKTERARLAVAELSRQASCVISPNPIILSPALSPPPRSPRDMLNEFHTKLKSVKGKVPLSPSSIGCVSYSTPDTRRMPSLRSLPKTYQQLGLQPLTRSPSSENYFPRMAQIFREQERKLASKSPTKIKGKASKVLRKNVKKGAPKLQRRPASSAADILEASPSMPVGSKSTEMKKVNTTLIA